MHSYLTPEPITCEVRNGSGAVTIDLTDTSMTTVELLPAEGQGWFLDEVLRTVSSTMSGWGGRGDRARGGRTEAAESSAAPTGEAADDVVVEFQSGTLMVDSEPARRRWHTGFIVRITAPKGSSVRARTETAPVSITGSTDRVEIKTAAGDVMVDSTNGNALVRTVSGDIDVRDASSGSLDLAAVSGSLSIGVHTGVSAKVELSTVSGTAESRLPVVGTLDGSTLTIKGRTVSGNITLVAAGAN